MKGIIRSRLNAYTDRGDIAGGSILVRKNGETVAEVYAGEADIALGVPVTKDSIFRLASMSKPVAAAAVMLLVQENKVDITDPLCKYLPEFKDLCVGIKEENGRIAPVTPDRPVTVEDLLRHRSGMGQGEISASFGVNEVHQGMTLKERAEAVARCPLDFQPGAEAGYSALTAFDVLGRVVEVVSGTAFEVFLKEKFFDPLGMTDTTFFLNEAQKKRLVRLYDRSGGTLTDSYAPGEISSPFMFSYPSGSAGLFGTLTDYDKFVQMLAGRGVRILTDETLGKMAQADQSHMSKTGAWGLGMHVFNRKSVSSRALSQNTFGWSGAFGTHFYIDPVNDVTMTLMVNRMDIGGSDSYVSFGMEEAVFEEMELKEI
ncbi:MAG: beta-lactamase family protein [Clostridia bacterium]|nr:beta-lactamase family protein [Clostridia bacterium]